MQKAFYKTAKEIVETGFDALPSELVSSKHLIYSSPATLSFNSPGAKGYGVKRAGLAVPGSVMLLVSPGCCGRNTSLFKSSPEYKDKFFFQLLDDTDIVTGRHLMKITDAVREMLDFLEKRPSAVMICITCVDALLGTDMERICKKVTEETSIPCVACYMYALTREKRLSPMAYVRTSVYTLLEKQKRENKDMNILGFFSPISSSSEIFDLLHDSGIKNIRELARCSSFEEYKELSKANFNLVLNPEARHAALDMQKRLGIPFIEMLRLYQPDKIHNQYMLLKDAIGVDFDDSVLYENTVKCISDFREKHGKLRFAVGEILNADAIELALMLVKEGFEVKSVFATIGELNYSFLKALAKLSPDTKIYSNLSPTMLNYEPDDIDCYIGSDCLYYFNDKPGIEWCEDVEPFGYDAVCTLFNRLDAVLDPKTN
ncbi:MAG: nitrogenase component 1 [Lachnospiraceae bacterium]|nr:nitrogenase component 1 [Lachnospiraceae bacterium]